MVIERILNYSGVSFLTPLIMKVEDKMHKYEEQAFLLASPICVEVGIDLVEVSWVKEYNSYFLRIIIDKEGGITVDDATIISEKLSPLLDKEDFIKEEYILEVSSPGAEKELKTDKDILSSIGEYVHINLYAKVDGFKEIEGYLKEYADEDVLIEANIKGRIKNYTFKRNEISKIRLAIKF